MGDTERKYILTDETRQWCGKTLHRIKAVRDFSFIKEGALGGWIEKEANLSQAENCWIHQDAIVCDDAHVSGNARVFDHAHATDYAYISGNARLFGNAVVSGHARVSGKADVCSFAKVHGHAIIVGNTMVQDYAIVCDEAYVDDRARIFGNAVVGGVACVYGYASIYTGSIKSSTDYICIGPIGSRNGTTTFFLNTGAIMVKCGCFAGTLDEFSDRVEYEYGPQKVCANNVPYSYHWSSENQRLYYTQYQAAIRAAKDIFEWRI